MDGDIGSCMAQDHAEVRWRWYRGMPILVPMALSAHARWRLSHLLSRLPSMAC